MKSCLIDFKKSNSKLINWETIKRDFDKKVEPYLNFRGFNVEKSILLSDGNVRIWIDVPNNWAKNETENLANELNDVFDGEGFWFKTVEIG